MISLAMATIIAFTAVFVLPYWSAKPYTVPRRNFFVLAALSTTTYWIMFDRSSTVPGWILAGLCVMLAWWVITTITAIRPETSVNHLVMFSMAALAGVLFGTSNPDALKILVVAAAVNASVAVLQHVFRFEPFRDIAHFKMFYPTGLIARTPNALGAYLVPHIFLCIQLASTNVLWAIPGLVILWGLWLTKCRGALLATIAGLALYPGLIGHYLIPAAILVILAAAFALDRNARTWMIKRMATMRDRVNYLRISWRQIPRCWLFGLGFDNMKCLVPKLQREINQETNGKFLDIKNYEHPVPQKMHNDFVQAALDTGIPGSLMLLGFGILAVWSGWHDKPFLCMAMAAMMVNSLFFHPLYLTVSCTTFWFIAGGLLQGGAGQGVPIGTIGAIAFASMAILALRSTYRMAAYDALFYRHVKSGTIEPKRLDSLIRLKPYSSQLACHEATYHNLFGHHEKVLAVLFKAIGRYDGHMTLWTMWTNVAIASMRAGNPIMAKRAADIALSYCPYYGPALNERAHAINLLNAAGLDENGNEKPRQGMAEKKAA